MDDRTLLRAALVMGVLALLANGVVVNELSGRGVLSGDIDRASMEAPANFECGCPSDPLGLDNLGSDDKGKYLEELLALLNARPDPCEICDNYTSEMGRRDCCSKDSRCSWIEADSACRSTEYAQAYLSKMCMAFDESRCQTDPDCKWRYADCSECVAQLPTPSPTPTAEPSIPTPDTGEVLNDSEPRDEGSTASFGD